MKIYCDSSTQEACLVPEGRDPIIVPYDEPVTNNVGEYKAVILALKWAEDSAHSGDLNVSILTDSLLVVNQVNGVWKCKKEHSIYKFNNCRCFYIYSE